MTCGCSDGQVSGWQAYGANGGNLTPAPACSAVNSSGSALPLTDAGYVFDVQPRRFGHLPVCEWRPEPREATPPAGYDSFQWGGFELTGVNGAPANPAYTGTVSLDIWGT